MSNFLLLQMFNIKLHCMYRRFFPHQSSYHNSNHNLKYDDHSNSRFQTPHECVWEIEVGLQSNYWGLRNVPDKKNYTLHLLIRAREEVLTGKAAAASNVFRSIRSIMSLTNPFCSAKLGIRKLGLS